MKTAKTILAASGKKGLHSRMTAHSVSPAPGKHGFTLIELLVVMVIIALLAGLLMPAIRRGRARAIMDKAQAEMSAFASIITMAKLDTGFYVRLCDLASPDTDIEILDITTDPSNPTWRAPNPGEIVNWDGPYQVFQPHSILNGQGSIPAVTGADWDTTPITGDFPPGTPLDPWGNAYGLAYNPGERVIAIYSAGPGGTLQTDMGTTTPDGDDLLFRFR